MVSLFDRSQFSARSTLSRFLAALTEEPVEALRTLFQCVEVQMDADGSSSAPSVVSPPPLSRSQRAHTRLSWKERLTRNTSPERVPSTTIHLFGIPTVFARSLGLTVA